jgi:rod shape determining protein RodA
MSQRNPEISKGVDWSLVWLWFLLSAVGIMAIFGVTYHDGDNVIQTFLRYKTITAVNFTFLLCRYCRHVHTS